MRSILSLMLCFTGASLVHAANGTGEARTVSGAFTTTYWPDDGTRTTVATPPPHLSVRSLLVPDDSETGYSVFPIDLQPDYTFAVTDVPAGSYFLHLDHALMIGGITVYQMQLYEMTADAPDLSVISAARPDLERVTQPTEVTLNISNLQPWQIGDLLLISSSQADLYTRPSGVLRPPIMPGVTSHTGVFDWRCCTTSVETPSLPDASHGDVVFINQRSSQRIGRGDAIAELRYASRYARVTDFTVLDGQPATLAASLLETAQTGRIRADVRGSQFAALAADVHPTARPEQNNLAFSVLVTPHGVDYPDRPPDGAGSSIFYFQSLTDTSTDADYGTLPYPQFHDPLWKEFRQVVHGFDVTLRRPDSKETIRLSTSGVSHLSMSPPPEDPIAPLLGPPTAPLINGLDAFEPHSGVGLQPTISWSPPRLGKPTSYYVTIGTLSNPREGEIISISATVYGKSSFKVPPGVLQPGSLYVAIITASQAPWDTLDRAPFRDGAPREQIGCVTDIFIP